MSLLDNPVGTIGGGRKVVTTAGTRVVLTTNIVATGWYIIQAETDNTGNIAVGDSSVVAAAGSQTNGILLSAGQSITLPVSDARQIYIDSSVSGDGVTFLYGAP